MHDEKKLQEQICVFNIINRKKCVFIYKKMLQKKLQKFVKKYLQFLYTCYIIIDVVTLIA